MSDKLAVSSALSVLMMATYVLFGGQARQVDLGVPRIESSFPIAGAVPQAAALMRR